MVDDDVKLDNFDVRSDFDDEKVVHETDMFSKYLFILFLKSLNFKSPVKKIKRVLVISLFKIRLF